MSSAYHIKFLLDTGKYEEAQELVDKILGRGLSHEDEIDMHIQNANIKIRLGNFLGGREEFKNAESKARRYRLQNWLNRALTGLGWAYRLVGDTVNASKHYSEAYKISLEIGDNKRRAQLLNNMALLSSYQREYGDAIKHCNNAEKLWQRLGEDRGLGALYVVYGDIYRRSQRYELALDYYQQANTIFQPQNDVEWLSQVYAGIGATNVLAGEARRGRKNLEKALSFKIAKDQALILHWLGRACLEEGTGLRNIKKAAGYFDEGYHVAKSLPDLPSQLHNLWGLIWMDILRNEHSRIKWFKEEYKEFQNEWQGVTYTVAEGFVNKFLGDISFRDLSKSSIDQSLDYYKKALPIIAEEIRYGPHQLKSVLEGIEKRMKRLDADSKTLIRFGKTFFDLWVREDLDQVHLEALDYFIAWKGGEYSDA